ncbi:MAG: UDP-N-acetylmuramate--L-alanine ligase [Candidatus Puniceispirillum sp. TMED52]|nr:UDP-N-acetylmuramate--L-alanine ligase [SAR116 cluster bacterium]OUU46765.1 MAG: UDP-N-acetylmuramate--L-alanine ligase [Candidatus Puniceispirillum sp. TMED52]
MSQLPLSIGRIHFTGIGGIGMSGIAEILHDMGYQVSGSDMSSNANVKRLISKGIPITIGQHEDNVTGAAIIVVSTAIKPDNPEMVAARKSFLPIVHRAEMLGELMRLKWSVAIAGTHGKTTTTSLVASLLDMGGIDPTVINGGIITGWGSNAKLGNSEWMVVEADESDGSFSRLNPTVAVVTNIDPEHLDHHGSFDNLKQAFRDFIASIPFYGFASLCIDHPTVQRMIADIPERRIISYGFSASADVRGVNLRSENGTMIFDTVISNRLSNDGTIEGFRLPMLGDHNVLNTLAAISVCLEMGIDTDKVINAVSQFKGVGRRFDHKGCVSDITIIDDYGHHPVEITAALSAARMLRPSNQIIAVFQPHRYTRMRDLFDDFCACFNDADHVIISDIYAAGEDPIDGYERDDFVNSLRAHGHPSVEALDHPDALAKQVMTKARQGDVIMCLGAGTITNWAAALPNQIAAITGDEVQS